jgi:alcohol dehydrogenase YqhD (iron-dependent ADH family)
MPGWLRTHYGTIKDRLARFSEAVFSLDGGSRDYKAQRAIELIEEWLLGNGCSIRLSDLGGSPINESELVSHCLLQAKIWRMFEYDTAALESVIRRCQ